MDTSIGAILPLEEVFHGIRTAQEIDAGIQARSGSSGGDERKAQGAAGSGAGRTRRPAADVAAGVEKEAVTGIAKPDRSAAEDLEQLRRENAKLKMEIEILKKAAIYFARESK
jgi:transposase-like protein